MKNNFLYKSFIIFCIVLLPFSVSTHANYADKDGNTINVSLISKEQSLSKEKEAFIKAFGVAYQRFTVQDLKVPDKHVVAFLNRAFQEELDDQGKNGIYYFRLTDNTGALVGYFSIERYDELKSLSTDTHLETFPPKSYYIRQLYVAIPFKRKGIGSLILSHVIPDYFKDVEHIYVAARRINLFALELYKKNGFTETPKGLHGLPEDMYASFEWHKNK